MDSASARLSIWLPTFNRPQNLLRTMASIIPQLSAEVTCTVVDNCSDQPVEGLLREHFGAESLRYVTVIRNPVNIGGNANICRCFELCPSEWAWIIGDDDPVRPGAIVDAGRFIDEAPAGAVYVGMGYAHLPAPSMCPDVDALTGTAKSLGSLICLPMCLFRTGRLRSHVRYAYQWLSTCAPQLVIVLQAMHVDRATAVLRPECLRHDEGERVFRGSGTTIAWCTATLPFIPLACVDSPGLRRLIPDMIRPLDLIYELRVGIRCGHFKPDHARRLFVAIAGLKYPFWTRQREMVRFHLYFLYDWMHGFRADMIGDISAAHEDRT